MAKIFHNILFLHNFHGLGLHPALEFAGEQHAAALSFVLDILGAVGVKLRLRRHIRIQKQAPAKRCINSVSGNRGVGMAWKVDWLFNALATRIGTAFSIAAILLVGVVGSLTLRSAISDVEDRGAIQYNESLREAIFTLGDVHRLRETLNNFRAFLL